MQTIKDQNATISLRDHIFIILVFNTIFMTTHVLINVTQNLYGNNSSHIDIKSNIKNMFKLDAFKIIFLVHLLICIFVIVIKYEFIWMRIQVDALTCIICDMLSMTFMKIIQQFDSMTFTIDSMKGLDCGTYMAISYYHGYLKLIIPSTGTSQKGIIEKIENIEDQHNISITAHKLLILIPASSYIPPDLKEVSYHWMESVVELEEEKRDRAGVKGRIYRNNVYKIYHNGIKSSLKFTYVVAEGATPLLTFFEAQKHAHPETDIYKKHHKEIIKQFYTKLKELINDDPECKDLCELIYYDDYDDTGTKVNVAKVILDRLFQISKSEHA